MSLIMNYGVTPHRPSQAESAGHLTGVNPGMVSPPGEAGGSSNPPVAEDRQRQKARLFIAEDHAFVRQGLVSLINHQADLVCCGESDSVAGTSSMVSETTPDLLMLDLQLKDGEAFDLIASLTRQFPTLPVLVVSQSGETAHVERAFRGGARGYVLKQDATDEVLPAIRSTLQGNFYVSRGLMGGLVQKLFQPA